MLLIAIGLLLGAQDERKDYQSLTFSLRYSLPGGEALEGEDWGDFFDAGVGVESRFLKLWPTHTERLSFGAYVALTLDSFGGLAEDVNDDVLGPVRVKPDDMTLIRFMAGPTLHYAEATIFLQAHLGIGLAFYPDVDADFSIPGASASGPAIDASTKPAFELGVRAGIMASDSVDVVFGLTFELNSAPDEGDAIGVSLGEQQNIALSLGVNWRF